MITSQANSLDCHICQISLKVKLCFGRKSGKPGVSLSCPADGRHLRAFVTDKEYVRGVMNPLEAVADDKTNESSITISG